MKRGIFVLFPLLFGVTATSCSSVEPPLPDPDPVFQSQGSARQDPVFLVDSFAWHRYGDRKGGLYEQPSYVVGNKAVVVRKIDGINRPDQDQSVTIYVDNKQVGRFLWWGAFKNGGYGYPFKEIKGDPPSLKIDKASRTVTYSKPYLTPEGKRAVFTYQLKPLKDSRIELSWNMGVSQEELDRSQKDFCVAPWFLLQNYRDKKITIGGKEFKQNSREKLIGSKQISTAASGDLVYHAADPRKGYTIEFNTLRGNLSESVFVPKVGADRYELIYRLAHPKRQATGKVIIDLGEAELPQKDTPPPVGGIDFWKADAIHVPRSPVRNVMPNPSFEQGIRYWKWVGGGARYTPDAKPRYEVVPQGRFGRNALLIRDTQPGAPALMSFPISLEKDQVYTLSFYAKADRPRNINVSLCSAARGGKFVGKNGPWGDTWNPESKFRITSEWKRYSRTFTADAAGVQIGLFGCGGNTLIDGIQIEKGKQPTEFTAAPVDGLFTTSDPDNDLVKGAPLDAGFTFTGKPGTAGRVDVSVKNAFREVLWSGTVDVRIGTEGIQKVRLLIPAESLGEGIFVVRAEYRIGKSAPYFDYYRFSIMTPLKNLHPTKNIFGTLGHYDRITRGEELAQKYMDWGFGSTSWGYNHQHRGLRPELEKKYRIANIANVVTNQDRELGQNYRQWKAIPPELEKRIEQVAFESAKQYDPVQYPVWGFGNEEEGSYLIRNKMFEEYFKAQSAAARGVRRANPKAVIIPTCGTSGYSLMRGYDAIEGYLKTAQKHGFKYDAIAVHPYGNIDKGTLSQNDLDEETARLIAQMKKYGYGKETPIYFTEMFNIPETYVPAWAADTAYDHYQAGKPSYDFGNREFIHASSAARIYIMALKYWPQVQSVNIWVSQPFMDLSLTPTLLCKAVNTLGTHLGDVAYLADVKPAAGIRGYVFRHKKGYGVAPLWCVNHDVENGLVRGPLIRVKFGQKVEFFDLMGNQRFAKTGRDGVTEIRLTPAPLLIRAENPELLASALRNAETDDSSSALAVSMRPELDGTISAQIRNLTGRPQSGILSVAGKDLSYSVKPDGGEAITIPGSGRGHQFGKLYRWESPFRIKPEKGTGMEQEWKMDYFYVPRTNGMPDWNRIPAIPLTNRYLQAYSVRKDGSERKKMPDSGAPGDLNAEFKMAWDPENLYLRVEVEDDKFLLFPELWKRGKAETYLYAHDGCLEVYFDCGANGRSNTAKTYDNDDYRYDFSIGKEGKSGPGMVYRLREVYHQLADGINMATKEEAAKKIKCDFRRTEKGYIYTITFGQRYLEPIVLRKGFVAGFGLFLHDRDDASVPAGVKGLSLATEPGAHCDFKPHLWPLMILAEE